MKVPKAIRIRQTGTPETRARNAICEYLTMLQSEGVLVFWIQKNIPTYDPVRNIFRKLGKYERKGLPDLTGYMRLCGKRFDIEVKAPHPTRSAHKLMSPEQKDFINGAVRDGVIAFAASTVADVQKFLEYPVRWVRARMKEEKNNVAKLD